MDATARWNSLAGEEPPTPAPLPPLRPKPHPAPPPSLPEPTTTAIPRRQVTARSTPWRHVAGTALSIFAVLLLGFAAEVLLLGGLRHARDQQVAFADLRLDLAEGTAPVGQSDASGAVLPVGRPVALLTIPAISLREVVLEGTTASVLRSGPGHRRDTVLPGQAGTTVVMGRQAAYGGPFGEIAELDAGAEVVLTTGQGRHTYRVAGVRRAGDPQPPPMEPGNGRLTMVTGAGPAFMPTDVVRVDAELTSPAVPTPARVLPAGAVAASERAMASERTALVPALLLAQALLLAAVALAWSLARWGRWQTWVVGVPVTAALGLALAGQVALLLPNLL